MIIDKSTALKEAPPASAFDRVTCFTARVLVELGQAYVRSGNSRQTIQNSRATIALGKRRRGNQSEGRTDAKRRRNNNAAVKHKAALNQQKTHTPSELVRFWTESMSAITPRGIHQKSDDGQKEPPITGVDNRSNSTPTSSCLRGLLTSEMLKHQ